MEVFEFREVPKPVIIMAYYPDGNIAEAGIVDEVTHIGAFGQILDGLIHLHGKGVVHRDLKPENILVRKKPLFKIIITDFGLSKAVADTTLLTTFCGTLKYVAPEVFPGVSDGHGSAVDVWSLGVMVFEWLYGIPTVPTAPEPEENKKSVEAKQWFAWVAKWIGWLHIKLDDEEDCLVVEILLGMIEVRPRERWRANRCREKGLDGGLFRRRKADCLIVCADDTADLAVPEEVVVEEEEDEDAKSTTSTIVAPSPHRSQVGNDEDEKSKKARLSDGPN